VGSRARPRGGDELNLIEPGKNYGWPLVSYAVNYNGVPIPSPDTRPDLTKPVIYWTPIIAPGNLTFYNGAMFPQWKGSALMGGMQTQTLNRITFDGKGGAAPAERWSVGHRIRDVEVGPDGALWLLEDSQTGGLFRVTPKVATSFRPARRALSARTRPARAEPGESRYDGHVPGQVRERGRRHVHRRPADGKGAPRAQGQGRDDARQSAHAGGDGAVGFDEAALVKELGMKYVYIPMRGTPRIRTGRRSSTPSRRRWRRRMARCCCTARSPGAPVTSGRPI
jgi:hypothetical protein